MSNKADIKNRALAEVDALIRQVTRMADELFQMREQERADDIAQGLLDVIGPHVIKGLEEAGFDSTRVQIAINRETGVVKIDAWGANSQSKIERMH